MFKLAGWREIRQRRPPQGQDQDQDPGEAGSHRGPGQGSGRIAGGAGGEREPAHRTTGLPGVPAERFTRRRHL